MPSSTIGALAAPTAQPTRDRGMQSLSSEDFFKLLVTELRQQDPLQPSNTNDMLNNVSQIRSIELSGQLTDALDQLVTQQRTAGVSDLLGKYVVGKTPIADGSGIPVQGVVTGVRFAGDGVAQLELDNGLTMPAGEVSLVQDVGALGDLSAALGAPADAQTQPSGPASKLRAAARGRQDPQPAAAPSWLNLLLPNGLPRFELNSALKF